MTVSLVTEHFTSSHWNWQMARQYQMDCSGFMTSLCPSKHSLRGAEWSWVIVLVNASYCTGLKLQSKITYLILMTWDLTNRPAPEEFRNILDIWLEKILKVLVLRKMLCLAFSTDLRHDKDFSLFSDMCTGY